MVIVYNSNSLANTSALAKKLATLVLKDFTTTNKPCVLLINGGLGAGKTAFSKFFVNYFLFNKKNHIVVNSPTYTIANCYNYNNLTLFHLDLYRINHADELTEIGFAEMLQNVCLIEWASKLNQQYTFAKYLDINITVGNGNLRTFNITANNINLQL